MTSIHGATAVSVGGLVATSLGMLVQIAAGSRLYPSLAGPIVLLVTAAIVALRPGRWTPWLAAAVPAVLGVGTILAETMSGGFVGQLTDPGRPGVLLGSVLHLVGLVVAVIGGIGLLARRPSTTSA